MEKRAGMGRFLARFRRAMPAFLALHAWGFVAGVSWGALTAPLLVLLFAGCALLLGLVYEAAGFLLGMALAGCLGAAGVLSKGVGRRLARPGSRGAGLA